MSPPAAAARTTAQIQTSENYLWNRLDILGHGATCDVFKAHNKTTGEPAAVKVFNKAGVSRDMYQQQRELQLVRNLEHKNLVKVFAIEEEENVNVAKNVVVMELCEGRSLFNFISLPINRYGLSDSEFLTVFKDVTDGVKYLREKNVVHRDLKPGNIMRCIKEDGSCIYKLTDFGGARVLEDNAEFMSLHGTEEYLHPDVYNKALVDRRAPGSFGAEIDLWSLGATFYHCAGGSTPFKPFYGRNDKLTMLKMIKDKDPGVISGQQKSEKGEIIYSKELPVRSPMSSALKRLTEPILARLLEGDPKKGISFEEYFKCVESICESVRLQILDGLNCQKQTVYVGPTWTFEELKKNLSTLTGIEPHEQIILTERYSDLEQLEQNFLKFGELYVLSTVDSDMDTTFKHQPLSNSRFSKSQGDPIMYDSSLSIAMCVEVGSYKHELNRCTEHCLMVSHALRSLVDYCEDSPNKLEVNMSELNAKSVNLDARRKDILTTNNAFITIIDLLLGIFRKIDSDKVRNICKLSSKTLQHLQGVLTDSLIKTICNKLQHAAVLHDFTTLINSFETIPLSNIIQVFYETQDQGLMDFLTDCLAVEAPITLICTLLNMTRCNLELWAEQKENSASNIDEQLIILHSRIKEIQKHKNDITSDGGDVISRLGEIGNIMDNILRNMHSIQEEFDYDKKQRVKFTTTVQYMHQMKKFYLTTLKQRAHDITKDAINEVNGLNKVLAPRIQDTIKLQDIMKKYKWEYKQDHDMQTAYERILEEWKCCMFKSVSDLAENISKVSLPLLESTHTKEQLYEHLKLLENTNINNKRLVRENSEMLTKLMALMQLNLNS